MLKTRRRKLRRINRNKSQSKKIVLVIAAIFVLVIFFKLFIQARSIFPIIWQLVFTHDINLSNTNGRINILLLGIGGGNHDGPNLTDTIILASIDSKNNKISLLSIPRDLWIPELGGKINTAYANGQAKQAGDGLVLAKAAIEKVTGQQINYGVRLDFNGFVKIVNLVGGLDINVDRTFDDYEYPIDGKENDNCGHSPDEIAKLASSSSQLTTFPCRYMHIHFNAGLMHMDGATALIYVRSRHALGVEGSDFARSRREEKVIAALKSKILSVQTLINPEQVINLYNALKASIDTDIPSDKFDDFIRLGEKLKHAKIQSFVIDEGDAIQNRPGLLTNPTSDLAEYNYAWVLIPRIGNGRYLEIQNYTNCVFTKSNCQVSKSP